MDNDWLGLSSEIREPLLGFSSAFMGTPISPCGSSSGRVRYYGIRTTPSFLPNTVATCHWAGHLLIRTQSWTHKRRMIIFVQGVMAVLATLGRVVVVAELFAEFGDLLFG